MSVFCMSLPVQVHILSTTPTAAPVLWTVPVAAAAASPSPAVLHSARCLAAPLLCRSGDAGDAGVVALHLEESLLLQWLPQRDGHPVDAQQGATWLVLWRQAFPSVMRRGRKLCPGMWSKLHRQVTHMRTSMSPGLQHLCQCEERCGARRGSNAKIVKVSRRIHAVEVEVVAEILAGVDDLHEQYAASSLHRQHPALAHTPHLHSFRAHGFRKLAVCPQAGDCCVGMTKRRSLLTTVRPGPFRKQLAARRGSSASASAALPLRSHTKLLQVAELTSLNAPLAPR
jgi:hypothetical protein